MNAVAVLWVIVYAALFGVGASAIGLYALPRRWLSLVPSGPEVIPRGAPLPWNFSNRFGRLIWCLLYISAGTLAVALAVGWMVEQG